MAALDAILSPEWEHRYFSFDSRWSPGQEMASMRNGSGDEYSIVFSAAGVFIRGFAHESSMSPYGGGLWPGLIDSVPDVFAGSVNEPAFSFDDRLNATVCIWRETADDRWHTGDIDYPDDAYADGADDLFAVLVEGLRRRICASRRTTTTSSRSTRAWCAPSTRGAADRRAGPPAQPGPDGRRPRRRPRRNRLRDRITLCPAARCVRRLGAWRAPSSSVTSTAASTS